MCSVAFELSPLAFGFYPSDHPQRVYTCEVIAAGEVVLNLNGAGPQGVLDAAGQRKWSVA